ncbi:hypothetical protein P4O66_009795 [Electrophorus voltai]|uniref:Espin like a n=1 Tax=Electrophorus voltai TaxID=2609070 RepID=A0AAD8ZF48_9TELE|nr:hypothetical protein P4O66_009795 [Electrophorus voltai]
MAADSRALNGATPLHDTAATGHACEVQWLVQCAACSVQVRGRAPARLAPNQGSLGPRPLESMEGFHRLAVQSHCMMKLTRSSGAPGTSLTLMQTGSFNLNKLLLEFAASWVRLRCAFLSAPLSFAKAITFVQEQDATGAPALHLAAWFGKAEVVHWLLAFGGRADQETNCGALPAHYAAAKDDLACLKLLIGQAPGCVNRQTLIGATPVYLACQEGHLHMLEYLVKDCGADVHLRAKDGMTSLHTAAHMGHHSLVVWLCCRVLVQHSLRPSEKDVDGFTAADLAEYNAHYECASYWFSPPLAALLASQSTVRVKGAIQSEFSARWQPWHHASGWDTVDGAERLLALICRLGVGDWSSLTRSLQYNMSLCLLVLLKARLPSIAPPRVECFHCSSRLFAFLSASVWPVESAVGLLHPPRCSCGEAAEIMGTKWRLLCPPTLIKAARWSRWSRERMPNRCGRGHGKTGPGLCFVPVYPCSSYPNFHQPPRVYLFTDCAAFWEDAPRDVSQRVSCCLDIKVPWERKRAGPPHSDEEQQHGATFDMHSVQTRLGHYRSIKLHWAARPLEEREKPALPWQPSLGDYYTDISEAYQDMDSLKHPETEDTPQARYPAPPPAPPLPSSSSSSSSSSSVHQEKPVASGIHHVQMATTVMKRFGSSRPASTGKKLLRDMKLGDLKSITSLKKTGLTNNFTIASKMVVLPTEEANLCDIDYLVPTHDEKGRPIAEWKRQVMVRQLQARLLDDEAQRRRENGSRYAKMDSWRYSQAHNAILGPFGELLTEDDLIYLEKQIKSVSMQKHCEGYEVELARLAEELRNILPAPIVNITVNTQYRNPNTQIPLPVWCNRISGIVKSMSLLLTNLTDEPYCKMLNTELVTVFSQNFERQNLARGRREQIENEIHKFGVSVCNLKSNFENQGPPTAMHPESTKPPAPEEEPPGGDSGRASEDHDLEPEAEQNDSGLNYHEVTDVMESTSLRKERIVVLFLGHWKKSAYTVTMKNAQRKLSVDSLEMTDRSKIQRKASLDISPKKMMENGSLGQFFKQRSAINKMIGNWRSMISIVPSRQIRRLGRQQALYSPEQFLPRMGGAPVEYDALTLDLFMLGYFHILEQDLLSDERKMRHLLCFEVFDHVGRFSWETVRDFHKAVIQDIEAGNREWRDGFEDVKVRFFGQASDQPEARDPDKSPTVEARPVPKVVVQSPTPDEGDPLNRSSDISSLSNDEICKYIDRSFAFWKEKEAELFDFE